MYQVIARKYRPQSFDDVVGQEHVKTTLRNAITQQRIAHGYIFSGQRGTGKTTMARIFARCLNCINGPTAVPCGVCASCTEIASGSAVDVIEIDAASNRGINEMRELRENVRYQPARDRFKIFIIDEAHQITNEAFNALLKTIEEPPSWAVFILCTTESHKIPATIASRCQHFSFRSVDFDELIQRLRWICESEGVEFDEESLAVLAKSGEGSVRDSLSALDQAIACAGGRLEAGPLRELLGAFSLGAFGNIASALVDANSAPMLDVVDELERNGQNLQHFARELTRYFRNLLVTKVSGEGSRLIVASPEERAELAKIALPFSEEDLIRYLQLTLDLYTELQASLQPRFHLEVGLLRLVHAGRLVSLEEALATAERVRPAASLPSTSLPGVGSEAPAISTSPQRPPASRGGPTPFELDRLKKLGSREQQASAGKTATAVLDLPAFADPVPAQSEPIDWSAKILAGLEALGLRFTADAVEHATILQTGKGELTLTVPSEFKMMVNPEDLQKAVQHQQLGWMRFKLVFNESVNAPKAPRSPSSAADEVTGRALSHPEVQRFRELFGGEVRGVRNLKE